MAGRLTATMVRGLRTPGKYLDGHGLILNVVAPGQRYWVFRYRRGDRERTMSLGSADVLSLADAQKLHIDARAMLAKGIDPLEAKQQAKAQRAKAVTFCEAAEAYIVAHRSGWRDSEQKWRGSLENHVFPVFGNRAIGSVTVEDVLRCLTPIWTSKTVTAMAVRGRIEQIMDFAKARGWCSGENPALWRGGLRSLLPPPAKVHRVEHRAALEWREAPGLMASLPHDDTVAARCLQFLILTACRSGEVRGCRWGEIDMEQRVWTIPAGRMKAGREHRVPLSEPAMAILRALAEVRTGDLVFFGTRAGRPLDNGTVTRVLCRLGHGEVTVHGMRSCFRDWCADTGKPGDLAEAALAHTVGSAVVRAYQRSDLLDARRSLMQSWADYLTRPADEVVVPLRRA